MYHRSESISLGEVVRWVIFISAYFILYYFLFFKELLQNDILVFSWVSGYIKVACAIILVISKFIAVVTDGSPGDGSSRTRDG